MNLCLCYCDLFSALPLYISSNNNSSDVDMTEDRTVKCVLPENDIKLEVKLSKLTELLAKFNVIKLIENEELQ